MTGRPNPTVMPADTLKKAPRPVRVFSKRVMIEVWRRSRDSRKNAGAKGVDGVSASSFKNSFDRNLDRIVSDLHLGKYRFSQLRPIFVPKKSGGPDRVICVPTVSDRLVQRAIVHHLSQGDRLRLVNDISFGFVKSRTLKGALDEALNRRAEFEWVLKTDIRSFFDRIDRRDLKSRIYRKLRNHSLVPILCAIIDCEIKALNQRELDKIEASGIVRGKGLRQGMPISPLLSNFVLSGFDAAAARGGHNVIRYADDLILFGKSRGDLDRSYEFLVRELSKVGHVVPEPGEGSKTVFVSPKKPVEFLGMDLVAKENPHRYVCRIPRSVVEKIKKSIVTENSLASVVQGNGSFFSLHRRLSALPDAYRNVFSHAENWLDVQPEIVRACETALETTFVEIFGGDAVSKLTSNLRKFLGIGLQLDG